MILKCISRCCGAVFLVFAASLSTHAATFTVTNTANGGAGSLRQAMLEALAAPGDDAITFDLAGTPPFTITPTTALPTILEPLTIDATTQPGYAGTPLIELRGSSAGAGASGLYLITSNSVIRGLCINRFSADGIRIQAYGSNVVQACYLGTTPAGNAAASNTMGGISISSPGNLIGGTNASERNVISGGNQSGVFLLTTNARQNHILGNYIGLSADGSNALGNAQNGLVIQDAPENRIGGNIPGAGNVISANAQSGLYLALSGARSNRAEGNFIGTDASGRLARGNTYGVTLVGAVSTLLGGGDAGAGNVISGNNSNGVHIATGTTATRLEGNFIGTDASGTNALPNKARGIEVYQASNNTIGPGNLLSGNQLSGVAISGGTSTNNRIIGNWIGVGRFGTNALANGFDGVLIFSVSNNIVGGWTAPERNVISGNGQYGVFLAGITARSNRVIGNFIGTDVTGRRAVSNGFSGVRIEGPANVIGGAEAGARNVISGNAAYGVILSERSASNNVVAGNYLGVDATGSASLGNRDAGAALYGAPGNVIGGTAAGSGNVISGNATNGLYVQGTTAAWNVIQGNHIGTDATGMLGRGNGKSGIYIWSAPSNTIGGAVAGARNIISGNGQSGIRLDGAGANAWVIRGNYIGTKADGLGRLGNTEHGIELYTGSAASFHVIGGTAPGEGNRIAYALRSAFDGVRIRSGCISNLVAGNALFENGGTVAAGLGIDLGDDGVTANDACDADTGANRLQNFPVLSSVFGSATATGLRGTLTTTANGNYRLHFYACPTNEPSGHGEGQIYLGEVAMNTAADCTTNFSVTLPAGTPTGYYVTATATDSGNNTSEFSQGVPALPQPALTSTGLSASHELLLTWPATATPFVLQQATNLASPVQWFAVTNAPLSSGGQFQVTVPGTNDHRFYRLIFQ